MPLLLTNHRRGREVADANAAAVADAIAAAYTTELRAVLAAAWTVVAVVVTEVLDPDSTAVPAQGSHSVNLAGTQTSAGDQLPPPSCPLLTFYTNAAVRSGHGRIFLPSSGPASNLDGSGNYDTSATFYVTTLPALRTKLLADVHVTDGVLVDQDLSLVVYSRTRHARGDDDFYFDVTSIAQHPQLHWLRSRATAP
jgi:hypothetical protein